ncbi:serine hydrolase [Arthrobacter sp. ISL-48]|uniref:serine hydrolase n=1 Tax=Arthrobacter sp. ISL-48 TaxID=2819110 RepID=UPI001BEC5781|nr:serine hydrolase [Arthrobacter sp. ISL-48]MBT2531730.1 serine hydrolase [Arthrobacter sp. ISL-48]
MYDRSQRRPRLRRVLAGLVAALLAGTVYAVVQASPSRPAPPSATTSGVNSAAAPPSASASPAAPPPAPVPAPAVAAAAPAAAPSTGSTGSNPVQVATSAIGSQLGTAIAGIISANSQYQVGVALIDLGNGALHQYGVEEPFEAASTAKILTAAAYYQLVEAGAASLDDPLGNYTSGFQLQEMVQDSDNDSWSLLMDAVGHPRLRAYAASIGVTYDPEVNTLSTGDMAHILAQLYTGKLLDQEHTAQLLSYMQNTNDEDLIPAAVPDNVTVFHKYGLLDDELHDAAILTEGAASFVLVVYTKGQDLSDDPERTAVIHDITRTVTAALF